jgi:Lipocalin-like domain
MHLQQLFGVWKLIQVNVTAGSPGSEYGPNPIGRIIFTPDGYLNAMITDLNLVTSNLNGTAWSNATDAEVAKVALLMFTYEGPFTLQTVGNDTSVHTSIEISLTPTLVGTEQVRDATLEEKDGKSILTLIPVVVGETISYLRLI